MRGAAAACCARLAWLLLACGRIHDTTKEQLRRALGEPLLERFVTCEGEVRSCNILGLADDIGEATAVLREEFSTCSSGCPYSQSRCDTFWTVMQAQPTQLRDSCAAAGDFPASCNLLLADLDLRVRSPLFDLAVKCSIISPGADRARLPPCSSLVSATIASAPTLTDSGCASWDRAQCLDHFCDLYAEFHWWILPRNLQDEDALFLNPYDQDFILPGCEGTQGFVFNRAECPSRLDVLGFCDCLCSAAPSIQGPEDADCPANLDAYLLFGRLGVAGMKVSSDCEEPLCDMFDEHRALPRCTSINLPSKTECQAMQLPNLASVACSWEEHSGAEGVLECLDGYRCSIANETWACCESHFGRARCPRDAPVMCDILCSGNTEYCCKEAGQCTPRACSPVLRSEPQYFVETTSTTTMSVAIARQDGDEGGFLSRLPGGWWVWLILVVPLAVGAAAMGLWFWARSFGGPGSDDADETVGVEEESDKFGNFTVVRNYTRGKEPQRKTPIVIIDVPELPQVRPLGVELIETRVVRVHPWGATCGWQVGDVIVDIAGTPVSTFEEIWARIQVERDRAPVRFLAERQYVGAAAENQVSLPPPAPAAGNQNKKLSKVAPAPAPADTATAAIAQAAQEIHPSQTALRLGGVQPAAAVVELLDRTRDARRDEPVQEPEPDSPRAAADDRPRFADVFQEKKKLKDMLGRKRGAPPIEVRYVRDAWGRSVAQVRD